ncbi:CDP-glycerol glycerophosphotransferase family protein [Macrococcus sp. DPC7161]|uniref:CDP-glycerol glycerophosphotransferase family protein n=1 Tax=Macrococcus sp. DPC7161 TaxID=2507060 RepID=UPI00100C2CEC|nr:CDP-glycerol glycerophosphotransferase family protein [Macrococcus sp. DPC7161]RXK18803.1 CDP-glycerol glycerophosphotransferase family protein [Macrococcus sp. DPC7161]
MKSIQNLLTYIEHPYTHFPNKMEIINDVNTLVREQKKIFSSIAIAIIIPKQYENQLKNLINIDIPIHMIYFHDTTQLIDLLNDKIKNTKETHLYISNLQSINFDLFKSDIQHTRIAIKENQYLSIGNELSNVIFHVPTFHKYNVTFNKNYPNFFYIKGYIDYITNISKQNIDILADHRNTINNLLTFDGLPSNMHRHYYREFLKIRPILPSNHSLQRMFDQYFNSIIFKAFNPSTNHYQSFINEFMEDLRQYFISHRHNLSFIQKIERFLFINKRRNSIYFEISIRKWIRSIKRVLQNPTKFAVTCYELLFLKLPIKQNTFIFESFNGKSYSDSPKYLYEYLEAHYPEYRYIWVLNDPSSNQISGKVTKVKRLSIAYYYYYATSQFWISNTRLPYHILKRSEQIYVQTWHGTPLKRLALDMEDVHLANTTEQAYKLKFMQEVERWDYLVSPNTYSTKIFESCFSIPSNQIITTGYPRNDYLVNNKSNKHLISQIKKELGIACHQKVILYAPTWRDDTFDENGIYQFNLNIDFKKLFSALDDDIIVLLRLHYLIGDNLKDPIHPKVKNVSTYPDIASLYLISDMLITDYSSVFFDFSILKRPQLFYSYDLQQYEKNLRGFYLNYNEALPGPIVDNQEDLAKWINLLLKQPKIMNQSWYEQLNTFEDGNAAKKVIHKILNK